MKRDVILEELEQANNNRFKGITEDKNPLNIDNNKTIKKDSIVLYNSQYDAVCFLSNELFGKLFKAVFEYHINGVEEVDDDIKMAFMFIKNQLDWDTVKYLKRCEKNRQNIKKRWDKEED